MSCLTHIVLATPPAYDQIDDIRGLAAGLLLLTLKLSQVVALENSSLANNIAQILTYKELWTHGVAKQLVRGGTQSHPNQEIPQVSYTMEDN